MKNITSVKNQNQTELYKKLSTYIGFAMNGGFIIYGYDSISEKTKKIKTIIICKSLSENSRKKIMSFNDKNNITTIETVDFLLSDIMGKDSVKAIGITNLSLAKQIVGIAGNSEEVKITKRGSL